MVFKQLTDRIEWTPELWDLAHPGTHTREYGSMPFAIPPTPPLDKRIDLQMKYSIGPNDPQWVYDMCDRIERRKNTNPR